MNAPPDSILSDPKLWISVGAFLAAAWSAFNSWRSRRIALRALALNEQQELRRQPRLIVYLANGYRRYLPSKQVFGFMVSVSNPSDTNNSIAMGELRVTYTVSDDAKVTCRVPHNPKLAEIDESVGNSKPNVFVLPARVDAHQTVAGWLFFALDEKLIGGKTIDAHQILLEDSHGLSTETEPISVRELQNENPQV